MARGGEGRTNSSVLCGKSPRVLLQVFRRYASVQMCVCASARQGPSHAASGRVVDRMTARVILTYVCRSVVQREKLIGCVSKQRQTGLPYSVLLFSGGSAWDIFCLLIYSKLIMQLVLYVQYGRSLKWSCIRTQLCLYSYTGISSLFF